MIQLVRVVIMLVGLAMTVIGCYFVLIGAGVPLEELGLGLGEFRLTTGNLSAGIIFSVFGVLLIFIAAQFLKRHKTHTKSDGSGGHELQQLH